jgi:hypothetical protein
MGDEVKEINVKSKKESDEEVKGNSKGKNRRGRSRVFNPSFYKVLKI